MTPVFALTEPTQLELGTLITGLGGGLALFLFGMRQMTESLKVVAGNSMKNLLARLTSNRFKAAFAGAIVTGVVQSSSVTTVLLVGFISAGLLGLSQSIGVIIGANIGTTFTAQIIAFQIYKYGLLMIAAGFFTDVIARQDKIRQWGIALMGLGLIFFGMELMSSATVPLRSWPPFVDAMRNMQNPLLAIPIGLLFTALVQSSSATTGIVIVLASQGLISLESGIGLLFGANIGTCVTAIISAVGRPREAVQAAFVHVLFNLGGVALWMFFISQFADIVRSFSPSSPNLEDTARLAADTPRQIANAHTLFNVGNAFIFIWFTGPLARLVEWIVPVRPVAEGVQAKFLDELYLEQPAMALDQVRRELLRLAEIAAEMIQKSLVVVTRGSAEEVRQLAQTDNDLDKLHGQIIGYLARLSQKQLVDPQPGQLHEFVGIANYIENIGDVIDKNLLDSAAKRLKIGVNISPSTVEVLRQIHDEVFAAFKLTISALQTADRAAALESIESKESVNKLAEAATAHLARRLIASEPNRIAAFQVETDIIEHYRQINALSRRIARLVLIEEQGPTKTSNKPDLAPEPDIVSAAEPHAVNDDLPDRS